MEHFPDGTLATHALTGLPFILTVQVPHSPFWQLYGTLTLAALHTRLTFWSTTTFGIALPFTVT